MNKCKQYSTDNELANISVNISYLTNTLATLRTN